MKISGIYKITNLLTEDFYIGSSIDVNNRWRQHKNTAKVGSLRSHLHSAIRKYGVQNFVFEVIEQCPLDRRFLAIREQYYIDTLQPSYNIQKRVIPTAPRSPDNYKWSPERKKQYSIRRKAEIAEGINLPPNNYMRGNKDFRHTEISKQKMRDSVAKARKRILEERGSYLTQEGLTSRKAKLQVTLTPERRKQIGEKSKEALAKGRGVVTKNANEFAQKYLSIIRQLQNDGFNLLQIAAKLNADGHVTSRGLQWTDQTVHCLLKYINEPTGSCRIKDSAKVRKKNADEFAHKLFPIIDRLRQLGMNMSQIAAKLNDDGYKSRRGAAWTYANVREVIKRVQRRE